MTPFNRLMKKMVNPWVAFSYSGLVILSYLYFDKPIAIYFNSVNLKTNVIWLTWITNLGIGAVYLISLLLLALFFRYSKKNPAWEARAWFLWLCIVLPSAICFVIKVLCGRARPIMLFDEQIYGFFGLQVNSSFWSLPSGHTTTIMGLVYGLSILYPRHGYSLMVTGVVIALTRLLLTFHYLSDILTASYLTLLEIGLLLLVIQRKDWLKPVYVDHALTSR